MLVLIKYIKDTVTVLAGLDPSSSYQDSKKEDQIKNLQAKVKKLEQ